MSRQERIEQKLSAALAPVVLAIENESKNHNVPAGSETHFKVLVVSPTFEGLGTIDRHRKVHAALADELRSGLHALTLRALTPAQYEAEGAEGFQSPPCLGGSKQDKNKK